MNKLMTVVSALLLSGPVLAGDDDTYLIRCEIWQGERVLGTPTVLVESGREATVSVSDGYSLSLIAQPQDDGRIRLSAAIEVQGQSHSPVILVNPDQETSVHVGDTRFSVTVSRYVAEDA